MSDLWEKWVTDLIVSEGSSLHEIADNYGLKIHYHSTNCGRKSYPKISTLSSKNPFDVTCGLCLILMNKNMLRCMDEYKKEINHFNWLSK